MSAISKKKSIKKYLSLQKKDSFVLVSPLIKGFWELFLHILNFPFLKTAKNNPRQISSFSPIFKRESIGKYVVYKQNASPALKRNCRIDFFKFLPLTYCIEKKISQILIMSLLISFFFIFPDTALSQNTAHNRELKPEGTEFWLLFMKNFHDEDKRRKNPIILQLFLTGDKDANVTIDIKSLKYVKEVFVPSGTVISVEIDPRAQIESSEVVEQQHAVHVESDKPISVYGLNRRRQTTDTYLGLPVDVLGTEYRAMCYDYSEGLMPLLAVAATEDGTLVSITPTVETAMGKPAGKPFNVTLNKGDVYQVIAKYDILSAQKCDLTGSLVKSNKKIAVFSGHQCAYVPQTIIACNHLVEQIPPVQSWGKHFYIGELFPRSGFNYRALAHYDSTKVFEDDKFIGMLKAGEFMERSVKKNIQLSTDKPALVAQYSQGFNNRDSIGDPMMLLISPTQQFLTKYRFATPVNGFWRHYVNVVAPINSLNTLQLDGRPIDTLNFKRLGVSRYSIAHIEVPFGTHSLSGDKPFAMYSYGFGFGDDAYDSYGAMGGQSFFDYEPERDSIPPTMELILSKGSAKLAVREDGIDDTGLKKFSILTEEGLTMSLANFTEGAPLIVQSVIPEPNASFGRMTVKATDVAGNNSYSTICYYFDRETGRFEYYLSEGVEHDCSFDQGFLAGVYVSMTDFNHTPDFDNLDFMRAGKFQSSFSNWNGGGGISLSRKLFTNFSLTLKMGIDAIGGSLSSPDNQIDSLRDPESGKLEPYQEGYLIDLNATYLGFGLLGEWQFYKDFYLSGGLGYSLPISKSAAFKRIILIPDDHTYLNGLREKNLEEAPDSFSELTSPGIGLQIGAGWSFPISVYWLGYFEAGYKINTGSLIENGEWGVSAISINFGVKYKLYF